MSCWTIPAAAATHVARATRAAASHVWHRATRHVGQPLRRVYHPIRHYAVAHVRLPHPAVITRIVCRPPPGFLAGLAKAATVAAIGGAVLAAPTPLPNAYAPYGSAAVPFIAAPEATPGFALPGTTGATIGGVPVTAASSNAIRGADTSAAIGPVASALPSGGSQNGPNQSSPGLGGGGLGNLPSGALLPPVMTVPGVPSGPGASGPQGPITSGVVPVPVPEPASDLLLSAALGALLLVRRARNRSAAV